MFFQGIFQQLGNQCIDYQGYVDSWWQVDFQVYCQYWQVGFVGMVQEQVDEDQGDVQGDVDEDYVLVQCVVENFVGDCCYQGCLWCGQGLVGVYFFVWQGFGEVVGVVEQFQYWWDYQCVDDVVDDQCDLLVLGCGVDQVVGFEVLQVVVGDCCDGQYY